MSDAATSGHSHRGRRRAVFPECPWRNARILGRQEVHVAARSGAQRRSGAHDLTGEGVRAGWRLAPTTGGVGECGSRPTTWTAAWLSRARRASTIATPPPTPVTVPLLSTALPPRCSTTDDAHGGDHISDAVERGGEQPARSPILIVTRGGYLNFSDVLCRTARDRGGR